MIQQHENGVLLSVRVMPGSRRNGIVGIHGDRLKIAVQAPPEKGKANEAVIEILAKALGLKSSKLRLASGATNQNKVVLIEAEMSAVKELIDR
jgi:uncharacterized protein